MAPVKDSDFFKSLKEDEYNLCPCGSGELYDQQDANGKRSCPKCPERKNFVVPPAPANDKHKPAEDVYHYRDNRKRPVKKPEEKKK